MSLTTCMWSRDKYLWKLSLAACVVAQLSYGMQAVEARREGAAAQRGAFQRAQGATHLMAPVATRKLRQELAKVRNNVSWSACTQSPLG